VTNHKSELAAQHLEAVYGRIAEQSMRDLPLYNERLRVEAVGFCLWDTHIIGVLITPWCMNLILMPGADDDWSHMNRDAVSEWELPAGTIEFNPCLFDDVSLHLSATLFSTVQDFPDHATARAIGKEIIRNLLDPSELPADAAAPSDGESDRRGDALLGRPVSRRGLLRRVALLDQ